MKIPFEVAAAALMFACTGSGTDAGHSCDLRAGAMSLYSCRDYEGLDAAAALTGEAECKDANQHGGVSGVWSASLCARGGTLGGCRAVTSTGVTVTTWIFPGGGGTTAGVEGACRAGGGIFIAH